MLTFVYKEASSRWLIAYSCDSDWWKTANPDGCLNPDLRAETADRCYEWINQTRKVTLPDSEYCKVNVDAEFNCFIFLYFQVGMLLIFEIFQKEEGIVLLLPLVTTRSYFDCPNNLLDKYLVLLHTGLWTFYFYTNRWSKKRHRFIY